VMLPSPFLETFEMFEAIVNSRLITELMRLEREEVGNEEEVRGLMRSQVMWMEKMF
jgi:hypothetical protein